MPAERTLPFRQAKHYHPGRAARPRLIVVHFGVTPETDGAAEGMQRYFAESDVVASAHTASDRDSTVRSVHDWDTAFGAPGANADGLHHEQAGTMQTREQWSDDYSRQMLREQTAPQVLDWSLRYGIPVDRRLTVEQVSDRRTAGLCGHLDVTRSTLSSSGTHTDPGEAFTWDVLLSAVAQLRPHQPPPHVPVPNPYHRPGRLIRLGSTGNDVRFAQWALGIPVDGRFGPQTLSAVRAFQRRNGLGVDGIIGPHTAAALGRITR